MTDDLFAARRSNFASEGELAAFTLACDAEALDTIRKLAEENTGGETVEQRIGEDKSWGFGPLVVYWDADPQREVLHRGRIGKYGGGRLQPRVEGHVAAVADILGDWREEIVTSVAGEMRIYTTTIPAADRRTCLMQDPIYRIDVAHAAMGYFQCPMLSYDPATSRK